MIRPSQTGALSPKSAAMSPLLGSRNKPMAANIAPPIKYGILLPNGVCVTSESAPIIGCTTIPVTGPASQIKPKIRGLAPRASVTGPDRIILICQAN